LDPRDKVIATYYIIHTVRKAPVENKVKPLGKTR